MDLSVLSDILRNSIMQIIFLAGPILIMSVVLGIIISIIQATTSIQDQTLTFVPKILGVLIILIILGNTMFSQIIDFTYYIFGLISDIVND